MIFLIRLFSLLTGFFMIICPVAIQAIEVDSSISDLKPFESVEDLNQMTEKQMNDLLGEDPYLGQTSYLQSPDGFNNEY